jgi:hypothetical protein
VYNWANPAGGDASVPGNWSPIGPPPSTADAVYGLAGSYPVTWSGARDSVQSTIVRFGIVTMTVANSMGNRSGVAVTNGGVLDLVAGRLGGSFFPVGQSGGELIVEGANTLAEATNTFGTSYLDGTGGAAAFLFVTNGGKLLSHGDVAMASSAGSAFTGQLHTRAHITFPPQTFYPTLSTTGEGSQGGTIWLGQSGSAYLEAYDGGRLAAAGNLFVGSQNTGLGNLYIHALSANTFPGVSVGGQTFIGSNATASQAGGSGTVDLENGYGSFAGRCWLGDADDPPGAPVKSALQIGGATGVVFANGIAMSDALSAELRLRGGTTQVIGGVSSIHQAAPFSVDGIGGPVLWFEGGATADILNGTSGGPALGIGRSSGGTMRVAGAGTVVNVHGATAVAESLYSYAELDVDSAATLNLLGTASVGAGGPVNMNVRGPSTTVNVSGLATLGASGANTYVVIDSLGTLHLNGGVLSGTTGYCFVDIEHGAQCTINGVTLSGTGGGMRAHDGGQITASGHCDLSGQQRVECDSVGTFIYNGPTAMTVASQALMEVFRGGFAQVSPGLDIRGRLIMSDGVPSDAPQMKLRPLGIVGTTAGGSSGHAVLQCPLVRVLDAGSIFATGIIAGRLHLESPTTVLTIANFSPTTYGRLVVGDSTAIDGFVSNAQTQIGLDTLSVLDANGPDLGHMSIDGGWLQMKGFGHLHSGDWLSGQGRVEGSIDVQSGGRLEFLGTIKGSVQTAGELGGESAYGLLAITGALVQTGTSRTTLKIGDGPQDLITVGGAATLAGALDVRVNGDPMPAIGDTFTLISAASRTGTFASVTFDGGSPTGVIQVIYGSGNVRIAMVGAPTAVRDVPKGVTELRFVATSGPRDGGLELDLPTAQHARITLYDVTGRQQAQLVDGDLPVGRHQLVLRREDAPASGIYFARAVLHGDYGERVLRARLVVLR